MPSFLPEDLLIVIDRRVEDRVHINAHQVLKVLIIAGRDRVDGLIRVGERIQKRIQRPLHQFDKGILHRVPVRAAEHRML